MYIWIIVVKLLNVLASSFRQEFTKVHKVSLIAKQTDRIAIYHKLSELSGNATIVLPLYNVT